MLQAANHLGEWTTFSHGVKNWWTTSKHWWESPRGAVVRIEVLVVLISTSMVFLAAFGSLRRRRLNFVAQKLVLAAYLSSSLVTYTLGSMQSSLVKSSMYPFWAVSLYILSGSAHSITAYSLDDNSREMERTYQSFLSMFYVGLIAVTIFNYGGGILLFFDMVIFASLKWAQRDSACEMASRSWNLNKMVADYMQQEHTGRGASYDPASMKGYHYLVDWPLRKSKLEAGTLYATQLTTKANVIDIEKIWWCESLNSEQRDACLSFSLFHLLRRRFFGFGCGESRRQKTHDFVFNGQLAKNENGAINYGRVFKVIDVELAFMYDFFFTKHAVTYYHEQRIVSTMLRFTLIMYALMSATIAVSRGPLARFLRVRNWSPVVTTTTTDVIFTLVILACIAMLEVLQMLLYWTTIWGTVHLACHSVRRREALRTREDLAFRVVESFRAVPFKIRSFISNKYCYWFPQRNQCYWQNMLGQYSLVESARYKPILSKALHALSKLDPYVSVANSEVIFPFMNNLGVRWSAGKPGKPVELSAEVKEALVQSLECTQGVLTNGQSSLRSNRADDLLWACRHDDMHQYSGTGSSEQKDNQTHFILTWHIATCYCEGLAKMAYPCPSVGGDLKQRDLDVATKLSKYCAYLVVSEPKLLPGHHYDTSRVFDAVVEEAIGFLQSESIETCESKEEIFHKGMRLGKQLEGMEEGARWKVLADFWAEMLLYLAPSDNVKEHVECLAKGGEFITHLWALLTHAGILERGQRIVIPNDIENAGADEPYPGGEESSYCRFWEGSPIFIQDII
nr:uncharacterized protein LOC117844663 isoform X2 [Setaria viridis]